MSFTIQVCAVVERETGEHITPGTRLEDLGLDSLEYANLLLEVSKSTGKEIPLSAGANFTMSVTLLESLSSDHVSARKVA